MSKYVYLFMYIFIYVFNCKYMFMYVYICICMSMYVCIYSKWICVYMFISRLCFFFPGKQPRICSWYTVPFLIPCPEWEMGLL